MLHNLCCYVCHDGILSVGVLCAACYVYVVSKPMAIRGERDGCLHIVHILHMRKARLLRSNDSPRVPSW